jgi:hypothetical protein
VPCLTAPPRATCHVLSKTKHIRRQAFRFAAATLIVAVASGCARLGTSATPVPIAQSTTEPSSEIAGLICPGTLPEPDASIPPPGTDERYELTDNVELLTDGLRASHGDWIDTLWVEHEPEFQLIMRVTQGTSPEELCDLVADWPINVIVQPPSSHTIEELERGARILGRMWMQENPLFATLNDAELWPDSRTASVRITSSNPLPEDILAEMSEIAGVPVTFELVETERDYGGKPPECFTPWAHCMK